MATAVFSVSVCCYLYIIHSECHFSTSNSNCKTAKIEQDLKSLAVYTTKDFFFYFVSNVHWLCHNKDDDYVFFENVVTNGVG